MKGAPRDGDTCAIARCNRPVGIIFLGRPVCAECWDRFTSERYEDTNELRRRLGLPPSARRTP